MNKPALNALRMKKNNRRRVLRELRNTPMSRSELASATRLTKSAIGLIVDGLLREGLLLESRSGDQQGNATLLEWNAEAYYVAGVAMTRQSVRVGLANMRGEILADEPLDTTLYVTASQAMELIAETVRRIIQTYRPKGKFLGVGISAPGPLNALNGRFLRPPNWEIFFDYPLGPALGERLGCMVALENDSNAMAMAELRYGSQRENMDTFFQITVDSGLGGCLVINKRIVRGDSFLGGEFGHTSIDFQGKKCFCGNYGCAELYAAIPNIVAAARELDENLTSWESIVDGAMARQRAALTILRDEANYLSALIANVHNMFDLQTVVLSGDIAYRPELLLDLVRQKVAERNSTRTYNDVLVRMNSLKEHVSVLAAANVMIESFVDNNLFSEGLD